MKNHVWLEWDDEPDEYVGELIGVESNPRVSLLTLFVVDDMGKIDSIGNAPNVVLRELGPNPII